MFQLTTATQRIAKLRKRIRAVQGGTSASKTISILLLLINQAQLDKKPTLTSIVSESFPHLKRGVIRDFLEIIQEHGYFKESRWNKTDYVYTFENGSKIEFFSVDQPDKVRGPRRERLFINEANNIPYQAFDQLEIRTNEFIYLDWNPVSEYWFYEEILGKREDVDYITVTYKDNEALNPAIVKTIEQRQGNKNWWTIFGEGQLGSMEGKIYKDWDIIDDIPHEARLVKKGLDFGYTNDPSALVDVYFYNGGYIFDELMYQTGMSNKQIADVILDTEKAPTIADSAEPKSIDEISGYKVLILPAQKGQGSVEQGIQFVQSQRISVTKRSINIIKEYRNYMWQTDKNGKILNIPEHEFSHAMDAIRYAIASEFPRRKTQQELLKLKEQRDTLRQFDARQRTEKGIFTGSPYLRS